MAADPSQFIQHVIEEALARSASTAGTANLQEAAGNDDLLARILGERLAELFDAERHENNEIPLEEQGELVDPALLAQYEVLLDRNALLARALGACECWGEDEHCRICRGEGIPGWCLPDSRLFSIFVRPAIRALRPPLDVVHRRQRVAPAGSRHQP